MFDELFMLMRQAEEQLTREVEEYQVDFQKYQAVHALVASHLLPELLKRRANTAEHLVCLNQCCCSYPLPMQGILHATSKPVIQPQSQSPEISKPLATFFAPGHPSIFMLLQTAPPFAFQNRKNKTCFLFLRSWNG